jgi:endonuclease/exonuclease/phosphatase (EEP) superfamily protein YafD
MEFSVCTYNVLAQSYIKREYYPYSPAEALEKNARNALVLQKLQELSADVFCLQELEADIAAELAGWPEYTLHYFQKKARTEGCGIFFKNSVFQSSVAQVLRYQHQEGHELAVIAELLWNQRPLFVACTHLRWKPDSTPVEQHTGLLQLQELLAVIKQKPGDWLVAGDLNAGVSSPVLKAAYAAGLKESCGSQRPWDTTNINRKLRKLDFILYSAPFSPRPEPLLKLSPTLPMPSTTEPSDHLPCMVYFRV